MFLLPPRVARPIDPRGVDFDAPRRAGPDGEAWCGDGNGEPRPRPLPLPRDVDEDPLLVADDGPLGVDAIFILSPTVANPLSVPAKGADATDSTLRFQHVCVAYPGIED